MKKEELQKIFGGIKEKVGEENYSKMADDLATILTDNETMNNTISNKDKKIDELNSSNEMLITANGNLLLQVGMGEEPPKDNREDNKKKFSLKDAFDENGNFKK